MVPNIQRIIAIYLGKNQYHAKYKNHEEQEKRNEKIGFLAHQKSWGRRVRIRRRQTTAARRPGGTRLRTISVASRRPEQPDLDVAA
uniref:Uncharacterized protein n=1 Tax=Triticum urartu TaxID=4572 RepID=A0A8R7ULM4_TRIUA